jgi:polyphosphate glucokinase
MEPALAHHPTSWPADVTTLSIDIGGSGLKAALLDPAGVMRTERVRVETPYPCPPELLVTTLTALVAPLPHYDRVSVGFPGMVRHGIVLDVPSLSRQVPGGPPWPPSVAAWDHFDLRTELEQALGRPTRVSNDADMQGCAVVQGDGMEFVMTLGTGCGTALFYDGIKLPHLELSHGPFRKGETFDIQLGDMARHEVGNERWSRRVAKAVQAFDDMLFFDRIYLGGGNARKLAVDLGPKAVIVDNTAGIVGGVTIWELGSL